MFNTMIKELTEYNGKEKQLLVVYEELLELSQSVCKLLRYGWTRDQDKENFKEEITDVLIVLEWFFEEMVGRELITEDIKRYVGVLVVHYNNDKSILKDLLNLLCIIQSNFFNIEIRGFKHDKNKISNTLIEYLDDLLIILWLIITTINKDNFFYNDITMEEIEKIAEFKMQRTKERIESHNE